MATGIDAAWDQGEEIRETRVMVVARDPLARLSIRRILDGCERIVIVADLADLTHGGFRWSTLEPDVLVLNLERGTFLLDDVELAREQCPHVRTIALGDEYPRLQTLMASSLAGYMLKAEAPENLTAAVEAAARGGTWFSAALTQRLVQGEIESQRHRRRPRPRRYRGLVARAAVR